MPWASERLRDDSQARPPIINPGTGLGMAKVPRKGPGRNPMILRVFPTTCEAAAVIDQVLLPGSRREVYIYTYRRINNGKETER